jgi:hypothetical protein
MLNSTAQIECWECFELALSGPSEGECNPFADVELSARFQYKNRVLELDGFLAFFQHLERHVRDLRALGIEADVVLFHPYDRWGFATMDAASDARYLRYTVARLAAYRNVWWSLANEWDLMRKTVADWDRFFQITQTCDPYQHLRSIHNCNELFDHSKPWITHASIQNWNFNLNLEQIRTWRTLLQRLSTYYITRIEHDERTVV